MLIKAIIIVAIILVTCNDILQSQESDHCGGRKPPLKHDKHGSCGFFQLASVFASTESLVILALNRTYSL